ncbi:MAG TPA: PKD domain-containing protein, partial [Flavobacteriales bacterium]|nr:PKD domain-containing protein [Flavobacteriales bacterium]
QGSSQYTWYFGDGSTSTGVNVDHHYAQPGTYDVCLYAYWGNCFDSTCTTITVLDGDPCAGLSSEFTTGAGGIPLSIFYTAQSGNGPHWLWSFGDGTYSDAGAQGVHTYPGSGTYTMCLTVWDWIPGTQDTCSVTTCHTVVVGSDPCDGFEACFVVNDLGNGNFFFDNCSPEQGSSQYMWYFGDGGTSTGVNVDHHYSQPGTYDVCLYAYWGNCFDSTCTTITIAGTPNCDQLQAGFNDTATGSTVHFSNTTTGAGFSTTWHWSFGDGSNSTDAQPTDVYAQSGTYEVCLYAVSIYELGGGGVYTCVDTVCQGVVINSEGCTPFECSFASATQNNVVVFSGTANTSVIGYIWYFGDGTQGYGQTVTHLYEPPGPFHVCLATWYWNALTQDTCWSEHCEWVHPFDVGISELNNADVRIYPNPASSDLTVEGPASGYTVRVLSLDGKLVINERSS